MSNSKNQKHSERRKGDTSLICCLLRKAIFVSLVFFITPEIFAQKEISGTVTFNNEPLFGVSVLLREDSVGPIKTFALTDSTGTYRLSYKGSRSIVIIEVTATGYKKVTLKVELTFHGEIQVNIPLQTSDILLPEVIIRTEPAISVRGDTTIFKIDSFLNGNELNLIDAIEKVPGFHKTAGGTLVFNGRPISRILLEGDDLFGSKYSGLLDKLTVRGIDKLEVIQNYENPDNIISGLKEQVLNLKYKKGFLGTTFGDLYFHQGIPLRYMKVGGQAISLFTKLKMILVHESGNTPIFYSPSTSQSSFQESITEIVPLETVSLSKIIEPYPQGFQRGIEHKTFNSLTNANIKTKLGKKVVLTGIAGLNFKHSFFGYKLKQDILNLQSPLTILEISDLLKKQTTARSSLSFNYRPNKTSQLVFTMMGSSNPFNINNETIYQGAAQEAMRNGYNRQLAGKMIFNKKMNKVNLSTESRYIKSNTSALFQNSNSSLGGFFGVSIFNPYASQTEDQQSKEWTNKVSLEYAGTTLNISYQLTKYKTSNFITFYNSSDNHTITPDSIISSVLRNQKLEMSAGRVFNFFGKLKLTPTIGITRAWMRNESEIKGLTQQSAKTFLLPGISTEYRFTKYKVLNFSYHRSVITPSALSLADGFYIGGLSTIYEAGTPIDIRNASTVNIFYFWNGLQNKNALFSCGLSHSNSPMLSINILYPTFYYTLNRAIQFDKDISAQSAMISMEKIIPGILNLISTRVNISRITNYSSVENVQQKNRTYSIQGLVKTQFRMKKALLSMENEYRVFWLHVLPSTKTSSRISSYSPSARWEYELYKRLFITGKLFSNFIFPDGQSTQQVSQLESRITYHTKNKKWQVDLSASNILGQKRFSITSAYPTAIHQSTFDLFPRCILLGAKYMF